MRRSRRARGLRSRARKQPDNVNEFTLLFANPWFFRFPNDRGREMNCEYSGFRIESFEAGKDLWHARIARADLRPVIIDGVRFSTLEVGFAWSDPDAAIADAKTQIDRLKLKRYATAGQMPQTELPIAS